MLKIAYLTIAFLLLYKGDASRLQSSKYWLSTCSLNECSTAFSTCMNCYGEKGCKLCITKTKPECSECAEDIYNQNDLEFINGNKYFICDNMDPFQEKVCHLYCRGQFQQSGKCTRHDNLPVCQCDSQSFTTTTTSTKPTTVPITTATSLPIFNLNPTSVINISMPYINLRVFILPDGRLVRGYADVEIWNTEKGVLNRTLKTVSKNPQVFGLLSNGDLIAGYPETNSFVIWDLKTIYEPLKRIMHLNTSFYYLKVLENDDLILCENDHYDIVIRSSQNGLEKKRLVGHTAGINQILILSNNSIASCSDDGTVKIWNLLEGNILKSFTHPTWSVSFAFLKNGYLASGISDGTIYIWNTETGILVRKLNGHGGSICWNDCLYTLDNGDLLSGSFDGTFKIWNPYDGSVKFTSKDHKDQLKQMTFLPNGNLVVVTSMGLTVWGLKF